MVCFLTIPLWSKKSSLRLVTFMPTMSVCKHLTAAGKMSFSLWNPDKNFDIRRFLCLHRDFKLLSLAVFPGGVFFCQESFALQHASAIFEWVFCVIIMLFYGTFAFEFASMSGDTMAVLARGGSRGLAGREHKVDALGGLVQHSQPHLHQPESMSIL